MNPNTEKTLEFDINGKTTHEINKMLEKSLNLDFSVDGTNFHVKPKYYEDETRYHQKKTVGIIFEILDEDNQKSGEVVGYLYTEHGKRHFLVQYTENQTSYSQTPTKGLIRSFAKELLSSKKIDRWISSAEMKPNAIKMYEAISEDNRFTVTNQPGYDFRNPNDPSFRVELSNR